MIVPAVTEVCLPQPAHSQVHALVCSCQALLVPQPGQTNPCGQRAAARYATQAASSGKWLWNSVRERGKSVKAASGRIVVRDMFYHEPAPASTTNGIPGHRGISLLLDTMELDHFLLSPHAKWLRGVLPLKPNGRPIKIIGKVDQEIVGVGKSQLSRQIP